MNTNSALGAYSFNFLTHTSHMQPSDEQHNLSPYSLILLCKKYTANVGTVFLTSSDTKKMPLPLYQLDLSAATPDKWPQIYKALSLSLRNTGKDIICWNNLT